MTLDVIKLAVAVDVTELPAEFRLFKAGENETTKGAFVFDDVAAESVMAAYRTHGVDLVIDLEHLSLDDGSVNFDPDARGWCALELRDGELWAVNVRWTSDGHTRLADKRQRYVSPAFAWDKQSRRVMEIVNIALTAMPATHGTPALVAASATKKGSDMDPKQIEAVMKAAGLDPKMMSKVAVALGLEAGADADAVKGAIDAFAAKMKKIEDLLGDGAGEEPKPADAPASDAPPPAEAPVASMSSHDKLLEAVETLTAKLAAREAEASAKVEADERAALLSSRRWPSELVGWAGDTSTPIAEVRKLSTRFPMVEAPASPTTSTPTTGSTVAALSERELKICKDTGCDPGVFAARKAARDAALQGRS